LSSLCYFKNILQKETKQERNKINNKTTAKIYSRNNKIQI